MIFAGPFEQARFTLSNDGLLAINAGFLLEMNDLSRRFTRRIDNS